MKTIKYLFITLLISTTFTACASKSQTDMIDSNKQDISQLLETLIEKEKEINNLTRELENCKKQNKEQ